ncbi:MAG: hypothetical protein JHC33_03570 [Ignisphaera sp.]|jgi:hypothetical protein|nr:hypothetical protein [Ignisphaera sp.]
MEKGFKKLLGTRVYIKIPKKIEGKIIVDENTKEALEKALIKKMPKLEVFSVGTGITDTDLVEGCFVLVEPSALATIYEVPFEFEDFSVAMIPYFSIIHIW